MASDPTGPNEHPLMDRAADTSRSVALDLWQRLQEAPEGELSERDYLDRYKGEDGEDEDPEMMAQTGLNRILYSLDSLGGGGEKPIYVHLATGIVEIYLAFRLEDGGD